MRRLDRVVSLVVAVVLLALPFVCVGARSETDARARHNDRVHQATGATGATRGSGVAVNHGRRPLAVKSSPDAKHAHAGGQHRQQPQSKQRQQPQSESPRDPGENAKFNAYLKLEAEEERGVAAGGKIPNKAAFDARERALGLDDAVNEPQRTDPPAKPQRQQEQESADAKKPAQPTTLAPRADNTSDDSDPATVAAMYADFEMRLRAAYDEEHDANVRRESGKDPRFQKLKNFKCPTLGKCEVQWE